MFQSNHCGESTCSSAGVMSLSQAFVSNMPHIPNQGEYSIQFVPADNPSLDASTPSSHDMRARRNKQFFKAELISAGLEGLAGGQLHIPSVINSIASWGREGNDWLNAGIESREWDRGPVLFGLGGLPGNGNSEALDDAAAAASGPAEHVENGDAHVVGVALTACNLGLPQHCEMLRTLLPIKMTWDGLPES